MRTSESSFPWDEWYSAASPDQQTKILALAQRQGLLYVQQLPPHPTGQNSLKPINGTARIDPSPIKDILAGRIDELTPVEVKDVDVADTELDPLQRQAVARALSTPDICLIQGPPGTGKCRVVTEILTQASRQGLRVLFLAQTAACVDGVLERVTSDEWRVASTAASDEWRVAGEEDNPVSLATRHSPLATRYSPIIIRLTNPADTVPPFLKPLLLTQRMVSFRSQVLAKALQSRQHAVEKCQQRQHQLDFWPKFLTAVERHQALEQGRKTRRDELAQVREASEEVDRKILAAQQELEKTSDEWRVAIGEARHGTPFSRPSPLATRHPSWWTLAWWKSLFFGPSAAQVKEWEARLQTSQETLDVLKRQHDELDEKNRQIVQTFPSDVDYDREMKQLEEEWRGLAEQLRPETLHPQTMTRSAIDRAQELWQSQKQIDEDRCRLARQWVDYLEESRTRLADRLPSLAGIVAGTLASWSHEGAAIPGSFDLLVLKEADQISEPVLLQLVSKARRCVLVANNLGEGETSDKVTRGQAKENGASPGHPVTLSPCHLVTPFRRLWQRLHCDPALLPYTWGRENDQLVCQLRPLSTADLGRLERENLADSPEIELRILTPSSAYNSPSSATRPPPCCPVLAQVVFPRGMGLLEAKQFIFRELQEIPVQTLGRNGWLEERAECFHWRLLPQADDEATSIMLEPGLCEWIAQGKTVSLEFAKTHWNRSSVLDWTHRHFQHRDLGRTVFLQIPHRIKPALAQWIGDVLFPGTLIARGDKEPRRQGDKETRGQGEETASPCLLGSLSPWLGFGSTVVFIPVTSRPETTNNGQSPSKKTSSDGRSLEIDLTTGRGSERVPKELLAGLACQGFANYLEAQAVVRTLERLIQKKDEGGRRKDEQDSDSSFILPPSSLSLTVIAFHAGQVELIRRLLARSASLAGLPINVGLPGDFVHEQFRVAVISLTRSTGQRSGLFASSATDPYLAMTRASEQLILVGDPDTLMRWGQTDKKTGRQGTGNREQGTGNREQGTGNREQGTGNGPVSYSLSPVPCSLSKEPWAQRLAGYLRGEGSQQQAFYLCEVASS